MSRLKVLIDRYFGEDAFSWFSKVYFADWIIVSGLWLMSQIVSWSPVYEREYDPSDHVISFSHKRNQISSSTNHFVALLVPLVVFTIVGISRRSLHTIHHGAIGLCASRGLARLITQVLKHSIGRLRPDFLARCKWDRLLESCTGAAKDILEGRKSFPSGHSSTAFSGMIFLSLWLAGQTGAWCFAPSGMHNHIRSSRMVLFTLTLLPIFWAMHVAVTRIQDHRHHKEDVIAGSSIGITSALIFYLMFWPSPFSSSEFGGQARQHYVRDQYLPSRAEDFELSSVEGEV